jgi:hypothetical protein
MSLKLFPVLLALPNSNHKYPAVERIEINIFAEISSPV